MKYVYLKIDHGLYDVAIFTSKVLISADTWTNNNIILLGENYGFWRMQMCSIAFYLDIIQYRYSRSCSISTTSGSLTLFLLTIIFYDRDTLAIIHCSVWYYYVTKTKKVNYTHCSNSLDQGLYIIYAMVKFWRQTIYK